MKKTLIALVAFIATISVSYGQGSVVLANLIPGVVNAPIFRADGTTGPGTAGRAQLYLADSNTALTPATGFLSANATQSRYLQQTDVTIAGNNGSAVNLILRAWIGDAGSNWDSALERGESNVFSVSPGVPPNPGANLAGLNGFTMTIVPEPSTIALGILGVAALLFRRRKA